MPHAKRESARSNGFTNDKMGSTAVTNGDGPHSQFLSHLTSYPVVSDGISTYKSNPYGAKSLNLVAQIYSIIDANLYKPISPYLKGPYSYVAPYVAKADSLGDQGLSNLDSRFPVVKEDTAKLREKAQGVAGYPVVIASEKKDALFKVYGEEVNKYQKQGYGPILTHTRALIDTDLRVIIAFLQFASDNLLKAQKTTEDKFSETKKLAEDKFAEKKKVAEDTYSEKKKAAEDTYSEKKEQVVKKKNELK